MIFDPARIRYGDRARLGMMMPSGNVTAEPQIAAMLPDGVSLHVTRLALVGSSEAQLLGMVDDLDRSAALMGDARVDLTLFHCTAVSTWDRDMEGRLVERIERAAGCRATATSRALLQALRVLSASRVVLVSPYVAAINAREAAFLEASGVSVSRAVGLGIDSPQDMIRVEPDDWYRLARDSDTDDADAVFLSCTAIRALEVVDALERDLGKPVVTSNQVAAWHCLRTLGIGGESGPGRLFAIP